MVDAFYMATNRTACVMLLVVGLMMSGGATAQDAETPDIQEQLLDAVRDGDVQRAKELIAAGASLSAPATQYTALHWAAERSQVAVARVLIEAGADVNAKHYLDGTPLHKAAGTWRGALLRGGWSSALWGWACAGHARPI